MTYTFKFYRGSELAGAANFAEIKKLKKRKEAFEELYRWAARGILKKRYLFGVIEDKKEQAIGLCCINMHKRRPYIGIYVKQSHRGQGLAQLLIKRTLAHFKISKKIRFRCWTMSVVVLLVRAGYKIFPREGLFWWAD